MGPGGSNWPAQGVQGSPKRCRRSAHWELKVAKCVIQKEKNFQWMSKTRPGPSPSGLRRPEFMMRPVMPQVQAYYVDGMPEGMTTG